jgi:glucokinase
MSKPRFVIGVDLGGTNVRAQVISADGEPAGERVEKPSHAQEGTDKIIESVAATITEAKKASSENPQNVGLAIPGHIDNDEGLVRWAPNFGEVVDGYFRYWENVEIRQPLQEKIGLDVMMGNDANCAALGEYLFGVGEGSASCLVMLTLGTGIGGGVVMNQQCTLGDSRGTLLLLGGNQGGVELGHIIVQKEGVDNTAGTYGSLEAYCQRDSIIRRARHRLARGRESKIRDLVNDDLGKITPLAIAEAADAGDKVAQEIWREVGEYLGVGIGSLINVFAPEVFAIGGQISKVGKWLMDPAVEEAKNTAVPSLFGDCRIVPAEQIDDAGILGAAALALEMKS